MIQTIKNKWRMRRIKEWSLALAGYFDEGREITNSDTGDVIQLTVCDKRNEAENYTPYGWKYLKILLNGKPVFEFDTSYSVGGTLKGIKRFNYGSWFHDVEEYYKAHIKLKNQRKKAEQKALFSPLDE